MISKFANRCVRGFANKPNAGKPCLLEGLFSRYSNIKADLKRKGKGWGRNLICNIQQQIEAMVKYAEYLAKNVTKRYGDGERSIGSSL